MFVAGDDPGARQTVGDLAQTGGLRAVDAGPLSSARALEQFQLVHMTAQQQLDTGFRSAIKIIT